MEFQINSSARSTYSRDIRLRTWEAHDNIHNVVFETQHATSESKRDRSRLLCLRWMKHDALSWLQFTLGAINFHLKLKWKYKQCKLVLVSAFGLQEVIAERGVVLWVCSDFSMVVADTRPAWQRSLIIFFSPSLWASLISREGVYESILICLCIVAVLVWRFDREEKKESELMIQELLYNWVSYMLLMHHESNLLRVRVQSHKKKRPLKTYMLKYRQLLSKIGKLDEAQGLVNTGRIDEAIDKFYCVNRSVYGIFIRGFLDLGNLERANQLFQELKLSDNSDAVVQASAMFMEHWFKLEMDEKAIEGYLSSKEEFSEFFATAANALLKVLLSYGKKTEAWLLFGQLLEESKYTGLEKCWNPRKFDSESCNIMVNECFKLGKISEAVEIFHKAVGTISHPQLCYRNLIARFCEQDLLSEAELCLAEMCSTKFLLPDVPTYGMKDAFVKKGRVSDAVKTVNQTLDDSLTYIAKKVLVV
ncbi:hypothetical protein Bca4012_018339 [Brassica carinata]